MTTFTIPYGRSSISASVPEQYKPDLITLTPHPAVTDPLLAVKSALDGLLGKVSWEDFSGVKTAAVAINDKTRPGPHQYLLPPLLKKLESLGLAAQDIKLIIATGTHQPMTRDEFAAVLPDEILARYPVLCHDSDDVDNLINLGATGRGTPVRINRDYLRADLRIVVGNIEPHQFQGFSGGAKSAAIGLAGRNTINHNHAMMTDKAARLGHYDHNPPRQDVEEIGRMIGIHLALNAILNDKKEIVKVVVDILKTSMSTKRKKGWLMPALSRVMVVPLSWSRPAPRVQAAWATSAGSQRSTQMRRCWLDLPNRNSRSDHIKHFKSLAMPRGLMSSWFQRWTRILYGSFC
jgi:nickel-dependent lactate racemase